MQRWWVFDKLDVQAMKALDAYRHLIGLPPLYTFSEMDGVPAARQPDERFKVTGEWLDGFVPWDIFVTATFRHRPRRLPGPSGLARVEFVPSDGRYSRPSLPLPGGSFSREGFNIRPQMRPAPEQHVRHTFDRFRRFLQRTVRAPIAYDVGFEAGALSGQAHFHALFHAARLREVRRDELWMILYSNFGCALVLPFEPARGAGWYLAAAYVGKRSLGWDVHVPGQSHLRNLSARGGRAATVVPSASLERDFFHLSLPRRHR